MKITISKYEDEEASKYFIDEIVSFVKNDLILYDLIHI